MLSQTERQVYEIIYMWNLKNDTNELIYKTDLGLIPGSRRFPGEGNGKPF